MGSNVGERLAALQSAIDLLCADPNVTGVAVSPVVESDPVGGPDQPDYLNAVLVIDISCSPLDILYLAHRAEVAAHRTHEVRWGPRTLDVDVLACGDLVSNDPVLTLPHPRASERAFVLVPWAIVAPDTTFPGSPVVPGTRQTVADVLRALRPEALVGIRLRQDLALHLPAWPTLEP